MRARCPLYISPFASAIEHLISICILLTTVPWAHPIRPDTLTDCCEFTVLSRLKEAGQFQRLFQASHLRWREPKDTEPQRPSPSRNIGQCRRSMNMKYDARTPSRFCPRSQLRYSEVAANPRCTCSMCLRQQIEQESKFAPVRSERTLRYLSGVSGTAAFDFYGEVTSRPRDLESYSEYGKEYDRTIALINRRHLDSGSGSPATRTRRDPQIA